jgi:hypothetical protein
MRKPEIRPLPVAVRVFPYAAEKRKEHHWAGSSPLQRGTLVIHTAESIGSAQKLTFGIYSLIVGGECLEEGLFHADDLPRRELQVLQDYVVRHNVDVARGNPRRLRLLARWEFLDLFFQLAYKARCHVVGFNLPQDISRLACDSKPARGFYAGGFSFCLWSYKDRRGRERPDGFRPRVCIKHVDRNRSLIGFTGRNSPDQVDLIPEGSPSGKPQPGYRFRGHFLDLKTVAFGLTDEGYSLPAACEAFGVELRKRQTVRHATVTQESVDDIRRDVLAMSELAAKLIREFEQHPIPLSPTHAFSPASIGKGYLRAMGIKPILHRQPNFPNEYLGFAQTAFFGGRTSVHIRKVICPVVYLDFLSMYSTANTLMGLWPFVVAREIRVIEHCKTQVEEFLRELTPDMLFEPGTWTRMNGFVKVVPNGDVLPVRSKYSPANNDWQVGLNHLYANKEDALWYSIPDVVASILATGRVPEIVDAFLIEPSGTLFEANPTKLRGMVQVDPEHDDFFRVIVDERLRLSSRSNLSAIEAKRLDKALKILASATCFGIYAQMDRRDENDKVEVTCHGIDPAPFTCAVSHPEFPGEFWFAPLGSLITAGARLMLALLDHSICKLHGSYVTEDTDSMALVATEQGGLIPCPGGPFRMPDGCSAVRALSWREVAEIVSYFVRLNPYTDKSRSILKIERDNYDPETGKQRQVYCLAISSKRYALFLRDEDGNPMLLQKGINNHEDRWSEHGLGHLRNPLDPENEDRSWIREAWMRVIRRTLGLPLEFLGFEHLPAIGRVPITNPTALRSLAKLNRGKKYHNRIKPFDLLLSCHVKPFGYPPDVDPEKFHLVAPYVPDPECWVDLPWIDQYSGKQYEITTEGFHGSRGVARVKTYGEVLREYEFHPGATSADVKGKPSGKQTVGLLRRRHVRVERIIYIGRESNRLEEIEAGIIHSPEGVYTEYPDPRREEWQMRILPILQKIPIAILKRFSGRSRSMLRRTITGRSRPRKRNQELLKSILRRLGVI